jgi:hypothetical protein
MVPRWLCNSSRAATIICFMLGFFGVSWSYGFNSSIFRVISCADFPNCLHSYWLKVRTMGASGLSRLTLKMSEILLKISAFVPLLPGNSWSAFSIMSLRDFMLFWEWIEYDTSLWMACAWELAASVALISSVFFYWRFFKLSATFDPFFDDWLCRLLEVSLLTWMFSICLIIE